eukprot:9176404-Pyramimonas_sp.AAC.1
MAHQDASNMTKYGLQALPRTAQDSPTHGGHQHDGFAVVAVIRFCATNMSSNKTHDIRPHL